MDVVADIKVEPKLESDELWFKDAIIYQLHVKAFADSNNDGIGDFAGLTEKLDYLGDHRARHQSHLRSTSLVPARTPKKTDIRCPQLVRVER